jgi:hypothetical protein
MPNTITPHVLRERFAAKYARPSQLSTSAIMRLWAGTATNRARGRNVGRDALEARAMRCVEAMAERDVYDE